MFGKFTAHKDTTRQLVTSRPRLVSTTTQTHITMEQPSVLFILGDVSDIALRFKVISCLWHLWVTARQNNNNKFSVLSWLFSLPWKMAMQADGEKPSRLI